MDRRDALKAFGALAAGAKLTVAPVTSHNGGTDIAVVLFKCSHALTLKQAQQLKDNWRAMVEGTALEDVKAFVVGHDMNVEIVRATKQTEG